MPAHVSSSVLPRNAPRMEVTDDVPRRRPSQRERPIRTPPPRRLSVADLRLLLGDAAGHHCRAADREDVSPLQRQTGTLITATRRSVPHQHSCSSAGTGSGCCARYSSVTSFGSALQACCAGWRAMVSAGVPSHRRRRSPPPMTGTSLRRAAAISSTTRRRQCQQDTSDRHGILSRPRWRRGSRIVVQSGASSSLLPARGCLRRRKPSMAPAPSIPSRSPGVLLNNRPTPACGRPGPQHICMR